MYKRLDTLAEIQDLCNIVDQQLFLEKQISNEDLQTILTSILYLTDNTDDHNEEIERLESEASDKDDEIDDLKNALSDIYDKVSGYIDNHEETTSDIYSIAKDALR